MTVILISRKKKFLSRFPLLFVDKIHSYFQAKHGGIIPYDLYTYGKLTVEVVSQGLQLYNGLKLQRHLSKETL